MNDINTFFFTLVHQGAGQWPVLDHVFVVLTTMVVYVVIAATIIHFLVYAFLSREPRKIMLHLRGAGHVALSLFVTWVLVWIIKVLVSHPRPFVSIADAMPLVSAAPLESFPSLHAALTMTLAIAVLPYHKHLGHLLIAFSCVIALSRLYVGVHYPFDIGIGLLIGFLVPKLLYRVFAHSRASVSK